jgi:hypothetical protein
MEAIMEDANIDVELTAIKAIAEALTPLNREARQRVLIYAVQHLGLSEPSTILVGPTDVSSQGAAQTASTASSSVADQKLVDIRSLKEQKNPSTDVEMATLVAYYVRHAAPEGERKDEIGTEDIEKYFIQAGYPLPSKKQFTLVNAKKAGYLESTSRGKYKLNSVGHNLVAHNMPRTDSGSLPKAKKRASKKSVSRATRKKTK